MLTIYFTVLGLLRQAKKIQTAMIDNITQDIRMSKEPNRILTELLLLCVIEGSRNFVDLFFKKYCN